MYYSIAKHDNKIKLLIDVSTMLQTEPSVNEILVKDELLGIKNVNFTVVD